MKTSNMVMLELRLSNGKLAQKIIRTATMTTTDLISNVGGTLGLFCGLSVLSLAEVAYWTCRALWDMLYKGGHSKGRLC